jgi:molybdopterin molybdotransferase
MISEDEARVKILDTIRPLPARQLSILEALDGFAAEDYFARLPLPGFDNSAMDGYAVVANDGRAGTKLRVVGEQPAGKDRHLRVNRGEAVRIFTGAPVPAGADSVVMQEDVAREGDTIVVNEDIDPGEFIRRRGCDLSEGQKILGQGERLSSTILALLAAQGLDQVAIGGEVEAAIISTGDELIAPGGKLEPGQIYESNSALLAALLWRCGAKLQSSEHCRDHRETLLEAIRRASKSHVLIVSGGVSVGEHDLVQSILRELGAKIDIWRVAIKPGKPFLFARIGECAVFGLPGNPVSAFVTFLRLVRPAILKLMGASEANLGLRQVPAKVSVDLSNNGDRVHYLRGKLERGEFSPVGRQESHALFGLSQANALLRMAAGAKMEKGTLVNVEIWD